MLAVTQLSPTGLSVFSYFPFLTLYGAKAIIVPHRIKVGTMPVDGWAVTFGTARRVLGGAVARPASSSMYQIPPITGQCTNHRIAV